MTDDEPRASDPSQSDWAWWREAVIYQIYPRSFADSNGDGIGDFAGMTAKLDHLTDLGVDAIWLSPHFPSPNADWGYDVSDYRSVHPELGTPEEFQQFLDAAHGRGLRVIADLIINHTSRQHPWFVASRSSRHGPKRDWYVWHPGKRGSTGEPLPPNNWMSVFGGPAWTYDPGSEEWYYHFFLAEQPDLNWRNPRVREEMWAIVRYWLDMGVDGFRLDAIGTLFEQPSLPDHASTLHLIEIANRRFEETPDGFDERLDAWDEMFGAQHDLPEVHEVMRQLRAIVDEYPDRVLIGESDRVAYYGNGTDELHLVFNFPLMFHHRLTAENISSNQAARLGSLPDGAWPCNTMGNHDVDRARSRSEEDSWAWARIRAALTLLLRGTPSLYYGEEIGMENYLDTPHADDLLDPIGRWFYEEATTTLGMDAGMALDRARRFARDRCRTPMQWTPDTNAGFSPPGIVTWLPVHPNRASGVNVAQQAGDETSLLEFYRTLISMRRSRISLLRGEYREVNDVPDDAFAFRRFIPTEETLVILNLSNRRLRLSRSAGAQLFSSHDIQRVATSTLSLEPFEVYVGAP